MFDRICSIKLGWVLQCRRVLLNVFLDHRSQVFVKTFLHLQGAIKMMMMMMMNAKDPQLH